MQPNPIPIATRNGPTHRKNCLACCTNLVPSSGHFDVSDCAPMYRSGADGTVTRGRNIGERRVLSAVRQSPPHRTDWTQDAALGAWTHHIILATSGLCVRHHSCHVHLDHRIRATPRTHQTAIVLEHGKNATGLASVSHWRRYGPAHGADRNRKFTKPIKMMGSDRRMT